MWKLRLAVEALFIGLTFWAIYLIDQEILIYRYPYPTGYIIGWQMFAFGSVLATSFFERVWWRRFIEAILVSLLVSKLEPQGLDLFFVPALGLVVGFSVSPTTFVRQGLWRSFMFDVVVRGFRALLLGIVTAGVTVAFIYLNRSKGHTIYLDTTNLYYLFCIWLVGLGLYDFLMIRFFK